MKESWDDCGVQVQALILAFDQTRRHDESEAVEKSMPKAKKR